MNDIKLILLFSLIAAAISTFAGVGGKKSKDSLTSNEKELIKRYIYDVTKKGETEKDSTTIEWRSATIGSK